MKFAPSPHNFPDVITEALTNKKEATIRLVDGHRINIDDRCTVGIGLDYLRIDDPGAKATHLVRYENIELITISD